MPLRSVRAARARSLRSRRTTRTPHDEPRAGACRARGRCLGVPADPVPRGSDGGLQEIARLVADDRSMSTTALPRALPRDDAPSRDDAPPGAVGASDRIRWLVRGREEDAPWVRPSLVGLLAATAVLYLWSLGASGWANSFYSAAVQAGTHSWKAFLFGSSDSSNFITVDKAPAFLWPMEISARIFGVNAWSILVPQALEGVGAVWLLYAAVRRWHSPGAGLLAGAVLALTPVAALMFRFN